MDKNPLPPINKNNPPLHGLKPAKKPGESVSPKPEGFAPGSGPTGTAFPPPGGDRQPLGEALGLSGSPGSLRPGSGLTPAASPVSDSGFAASSRPAPSANPLTPSSTDQSVARVSADAPTHEHSNVMPSQNTAGDSPSGAYAVTEDDENDEDDAGATMMLESPGMDALDEFLDNEKTQLTLEAMDYDPLKGRLIVEAGKTSRREYDLTVERTTIGRGTKNEIIVPDISMSRTHAMIERFPEGFKLRDLDSSNGILLNGYRVKVAQLRHGDIIEIGNVRFKFEQEGGDPDELWKGEPVVEYHQKQKNADGSLAPPISSYRNTSMPLTPKEAPAKEVPQILTMNSGVETMAMMQPESFPDSPMMATGPMSSPAPGAMDPMIQRSAMMSQPMQAVMPAPYMLGAGSAFNSNSEPAARKQAMLMKIVTVMAILFLLSIVLIIIKQINNRNARNELENLKAETAQASKFMQQGITFFSKRRWDEATVAFKDVKDDDNPLVKLYLAEIPKERTIQNKIEDVIKKMKDDTSVENIKVTLDTLKDVPPESVFYSEVQERLSNYESRYQTAIKSEIRHALDTEDFAKAESMAEKLKEIPNGRDDYIRYKNIIAKRKK